MSSRWVSGLSAGTRPVSAITTMMSAASASSWLGATAATACETRYSLAPLRSVPPLRRATANSTSSSAGSASAATATSRLEPMPPNALPVSSPASARANRASAKRPTRTIASPQPAKGALDHSTGTINAAVEKQAAYTMGAQRKTAVVCSDTTESLRSSLSTSKYGCNSGGPFRPWSTAFMRLMRPLSPGASTRRMPSWASARPTDASISLIARAATRSEPRRRHRRDTAAASRSARDARRAPQRRAGP